MILFKCARRRTPGVYIFRTRKHLRRGTEWGYAGKSNHLAKRRDCHEGRCTRHPECAGGKPWADLIIYYKAFRLPWWLGWQWVTLSLETVVIWILRPRYNWQKNPRRSKVPPRVQQLQRAARDASRRLSQQTPAAWSPMNFIVRAGATLMIVTGLLGWLLTR